MEKALLIYNPRSGLRTVPSKLDYIIKRFNENNILLQPYRLNSETGKKLADVLKDEKYSFAVISGGDGTVSSTINTILTHNTDIPLGIIPSGTCNDFARSLNIPQDIKRCIDIILAGRTASIDIGLINNSRYFLNTCAGGVFADVSFSTRSELKRNLGPLAYYIKALGEVTNIKPFRLKIRTDEKTIDESFLLFLILNGRHAAGFSNIIQEADISDGLMDILLVRECPHLELAGLLFKVFNNEYLHDRNVMWLRTSECTIEGSRDVAVTIDGEYGGQLPMNVKFINKSLRVYVR